MNGELVVVGVHIIKKLLISLRSSIKYDIDARHSDRNISLNTTPGKDGILAVG